MQFRKDWCRYKCVSDDFSGENFSNPEERNCQ